MTENGRDSRECVQLTLLGTRIDVAVGGHRAADLAGTISAAWDRCLSARGEPQAQSVVEVLLDPDEAVVAASRARGGLAATEPDRLMHWLAPKLTSLAITARFGQLWMLHAAAVADPRTGATVVLVAPSGGGKTTAAAALGRRFGYLTDETAAIRSDGAVVPYPKPLSLLVGGVGPKRQVSPTELGLRSAPPDPWLAAIALLDRGVSAVPRVDAVRTVEALPALAAHTSALQLMDRPLHLVAGHLRRTGGLRRLFYADTEDLGTVVAELLRVLA